MTTKSTWATYTAICFLASASAPASQSLLEVVRSCASQANDVARLQCYDRGVAQFKGVLDPAAGDPRCSNPSAPDAPPSPISAPATQSASSGPPDTVAATDRFGLTSGQVLRKQPGEERVPPIKRLTAHIVTLSHRSSGNLVLHLDNDQVWEQTEQGPDLQIGPGDSITIDRGLLGAYWLSATSGKLAIKVQRLR